MRGPVTRSSLRHAVGVLAPDQLVILDAASDVVCLRGVLDLVLAAYRRQVKRAHPDQGGDVVEFQRLTAARDVVNAAAPHLTRLLPPPPSRRSYPGGAVSFEVTSIHITINGEPLEIMRNGMVDSRAAAQAVARACERALRDARPGAA